MINDLRGWRMALVPDRLLNPSAIERAMLPDILGVLELSGYGVIQLPPPGVHAPLLAVIADQVAEYAHHGYAVVAVGIRGDAGDGLHWRRMSRQLRERNVVPLPRHRLNTQADAAGEAQRLAEFLSGYDLPLEQQRHWRV